MKLTTQLHLVLLLRTSGVNPLLPYTPHGADRDSCALLPFITKRTILRYFEGTRLSVFFTELLIPTIAIWSLSQPPYIMMFQLLKKL